MNLLAKQFQRRTTLWVSLAAAMLGGVLFGISARLDREFSLSRSKGGMQTLWARTLESASKYDLFHSLELTLFDWRVRQAARVAPSIDPSLGLVVAQDSTVENLALGYPLTEEGEMGLLFPRKIYGRVVRELTAQGAKAVAFDVLLSDIRRDHPGMPQPGTTNLIPSDTFFAQQVAENGHVVLAALPEQPPATLFRDAAFTLGEVDLPLDVDGSARRIRAFDDCRFLGSTLVGFAKTKLFLIVEFGTNNTIRLRDPRTGDTHELPIDSDGNVELDVGTHVLSMQAYESRRVWHMGIVLAAIQLGLDLDHAEISPSQIVLHSTNDVGVRRVIPIESGHMLPVDWSASMRGLNEARRVQLMEHVLEDDVARQAHPEAAHKNRWKGKLVIFGSSAKGNNLSDLGPTPLATQDFLVTTYVNVANGILQDRFVHRLPLAVELAIQLALSLTGGLLTWRLRTSMAGLSVALIALGYAGLAALVYVQGRLWLPIVHPLLTGLLLNHAVMISWRVMFEQKERQRVRSVFAKIVSPDVVQELLKAEKVGLGGARRKLTVFFADVRGFTEMTDRYQAAAEEHVRAHQLSEREADAYFEQQAGEVLATVNLYLATIADVVKSHGGTLDKYIGDCVMAFWGAPTQDPRHAVNCVLAAIDAQRSIQK
ncbi:MAG TPA: adenylate/guanylate cyclase domain-containing protein, partial [Candidatus Limnocylindria bacterium]|nr:adenylate/guanylate cyclase domain-containing protein [Candidatus Limnocylindria bacterium]